MELGALRYDQGFDEYEILKEFEILGGIVFAYCVREVRTMPDPCEKDELLVCGHRLFRAVAVIQQASVAHFLQRLRSAVHEREARLRGFNRAVTHELKNQIGAVLGAADLLDLPGLSEAERAPVAGIVRRNAVAMRGVLDNLVELSRVDEDARHQRRLLLPQAVAEAVRQLRDAARAAGVEVRIADLPAVEVCDNGLGVPEDKRAGLFAHGFRAHAETITGVEGTGVGLSLVKDAVEALGGRVWASFPAGGGACFAFALPARRAHDTAAGERGAPAPSGTPARPAGA